MEFARLGHGDNIVDRVKDGLVRRGVLEEGQTLVGFRDICEWRQGGGETYIADSIVEVDGGPVWHIIGKALFSLATPPEKQLLDWMRRREKLKRCGIRVPTLFSASDGLICEEFIAFPLSEELLSLVSRELGLIAARLDAAGFVTINFVADMRYQDGNLFYVDFGSDLGEPGEEPTKAAKTVLGKLLPPDIIAVSMSAYEEEFRLIEDAQGSE
jgi:hypothetical protein